MTADFVEFERRPSRDRKPGSRRCGSGRRAHFAPVLPAGWAPLTPAQQAAVLDACDGAAEPELLLRVCTSDDTEYRVYRLDDTWAGLAVATMSDGPMDLCPGTVELLGLGATENDAVRIVMARLSAIERADRLRHSRTAPPAASEDPRRI